MRTSDRPTLSGHDYRSDEVYALEQERIFHREWFYVCRNEQLADVGSRWVTEVAGESVVIVRDREGTLRAFANVCRHRGAQLCDESGPGPAAITCPYHGWSYSLNGELVGTPLVGKDEVDRRALSLWSARVDAWQGFVFVSLAEDPPPLRDWLGDQFNDPLSLEPFDLQRSRIVHRTEAQVAANWKILIENYSECLHCSRVHPELVDLIPTFRSGGIVDEDRDDHGVTLAADSDTFRKSGYAALAALGDDLEAYYGAAVFPNMFIDVTGASTVVSTLLPRGPAHTTVIADYLFTPSIIENGDFDPTPVVEFNELVAHQDFDVCERVQRGISNRAFTRGVFAEKDVAAADFVQRYLAAMSEPEGA